MQQNSFRQIEKKLPTPLCYYSQVKTKLFVLAGLCVLWAKALNFSALQVHSPCPVSLHRVSVSLLEVQGSSPAVPPRTREHPQGSRAVSCLPQAWVSPTRAPSVPERNIFGSGGADDGSSRTALVIKQGLFPSPCTHQE